MKHIVGVRISLVAALIITVPGCATRSPPVPQGWTPLFVGVSHRSLPSRVSEPMAIQALRIDLRAPGLSVVVNPGDTSAGYEFRATRPSETLIAQDWAVGVNGGYFLPFSGGSPGGDDYVPQPGQGTNVSGAAIHAGQVISPIETELDARANAILCVFNTADLRIADGQDCGPDVREAMAAGPRLLKDGQRQPQAGFDEDFWTGRHPRTAVGIDATLRTLWLVTVDGRQPEVSVGASLDELTDILLSLGASDAINLDGGGSTAMVAATPLGATLLNRPVHTGVPGRERPSANHLGVRARPIAN
jgi:exopolysaccharide biosynthesis protein